MARNMQPIIKVCRRFDISPAVMGYVYASKKESIRNPKSSMMRRKESEYSLQLKEKQKVKFIYGILERQFHTYYEKAASAKGVTGENLMSMIERRLDNVVYRLGFAMTRREARQVVTHGHVNVNGKRVDIASALVSAGDVIEIREASRTSPLFERLTGENAPVFTTPEWLERDKNELKGTVARLPKREEIDTPVDEQLIVELYSK